MVYPLYLGMRDNFFAKIMRIRLLFSMLLRITYIE